MSGFVSLLAGHSVGPRDGGEIYANAAGSLALQTDGTGLAGGAGATATNWYLPTTTSIGNSFWVRATRISGSAPSIGNAGVWLQMSVARSFTASGGAGSCIGLMEIATDASGVNIVSSYPFSVNNTI